MTLRWVPGWNGLTEPEAVSYVAAVEAADGQELEHGVAKAINDFVLGCKNDGIWDAIKACCILAGARTLNGVLVPLVGTAPTNYNFVSGDYDRETGLIGDGSTKYLDSNRANNADPQTSKHLAVYQTETETRDITRAAIGSGATSSDSALLTTTSARFFRINSVKAGDSGLSSFVAGLWGASQIPGTETMVRRYDSLSSEVPNATSAPTSTTTTVFDRGTSSFYDGRLAFYSIGESLDLAKLDTRVSALITAIGAAIP